MRIGSTNPSSDGIELVVTGATGNIPDPAGSPFNIGDVMWNEIAPQGGSEYEHQELGSDGNYYDASMALVNDSTIEVSVGDSGAGNEQVGARKGTEDRGGADITDSSTDILSSLDSE